MKEDLTLIWIILWIFLLWILFILFITTILNSYQCYRTYNDFEYKIWVWCFINYKWEYIHERLYIRTFEQNINIK
jgi:hypothetical protein